MIFVTGAKCDRCGTPLAIEDPWANGDAYIDRANGDRIVTLCKNAIICAENRDRNAQPS